MTQTIEGIKKMVETRKKNGSYKAWNKDIHMWKNKPHPKGMKGKKHSNDTIQKIAISSKRPKTEYSKQKMSNTMKRLWANTNSKYNSIEYSEKRKDERKKFLNSEGCKRWLMSTRQGRNFKSIAEIKIKNLLITEKINFIEQYKIENYFADFYLPDYNLIIECDGEYWHNYPYGTEKDWIKNKLYEQKGFKVLRIWNQFIKEFDNKILLHLILLAGQRVGVIYNGC